MLFWSVLPVWSGVGISCLQLNASCYYYQFQINLIPFSPNPLQLVAHGDESADLICNQKFLSVISSDLSNLEC